MSRKTFGLAAVLAIMACGALAWCGGVGARCITSPPPQDAVILFDGQDTSKWTSKSGDQCPWAIEERAMLAKDTDIITKDEFGDHQLHIEFQVPVKPDPNARGYGNSGVYLHGDYEIQVIDSYDVAPNPGNSCGAVYGQAAPMVNASLPAGKWQSFDVFFEAPRFDANGNSNRKARMSVLHNGVWIHHDREFDMTPGGLQNNLKTAGPLLLQYHGYPVRFRNIWVRPLALEPTAEAK